MVAGWPALAHRAADRLRRVMGVEVKALLASRWKLSCKDCKTAAALAAELRGSIVEKRLG